MKKLNALSKLRKPGGGRLSEEIGKEYAPGDHSRGGGISKYGIEV